MRASVFLAAVHAHSDGCNQLLVLLAGQIRTLANRVNEFTTLDGRYRMYAELLRFSRLEPGEPEWKCRTGLRIPVRRKRLSSSRMHRLDDFERCPIRRSGEALRPDGNLAKTRRPYFSSGRAQAYVRPIPCSPLPRGALFQHQ